MQVKTNQATSMITKFIRARLVPMLWGSPGIGKSSIVHKIAEEHGLKVIDLRLSQCDPTDLMGFPSIDQARKRAGYMPMDTFPIEGEQVPEGYNGWLLFLDEANSASLAVQAAAYKIILDRMVGQHKLHKNCAIVAAGNLETDGAIVNPMSTALQSRLVHLELVSDVDQWLNWAYEHGIDHRITSYIKFRPDHLYNFNPVHTDKTYGCNRTWEFANRVLKVCEDDDTDLLPMLTGTISEGLAREFVGFCKIDRDLPKIQQIIESPKTVKVPDEPAVLYAISGSLAHNMTQENATALVEYINRLPKEFQAITLRESVRRNKSMLSHPSLRKWITTAAVELF